MTESERRNKLVEKAREYLGAKKGDAKHLTILSIYNNELQIGASRKRYNPETRTHKMTSTEAWCATFASAVGIICGEDEYPFECSCGRHISQLKSLGEWVEDDSFVPSPGDLIYYDWEDTGKGDNTGAPNHVGIVEKVGDGVITVIEGNKNNACARRTVKVNGRYIRGFGHIAFKNATPLVQTVDYGSFKGKVKPSNGLNIRTGPGTGYKKIGALKFGTTVTITQVDNGWGNIGTGWVCLDYIEKV